MRYKNIVDASPIPQQNFDCDIIGFPVTKSGLSMSPKDMVELASRGAAISTQNAHSFNDGEVNPSWFMSPELKRGVDPADLWERQLIARDKIRKANEKDKALYGTDTTNN